MAKVTVTFSVAVSLGGVIPLLAFNCLMFNFQLWSKIMATSIFTMIGVWTGVAFLVEIAPMREMY